MMHEDPAGKQPSYHEGTRVFDSRRSNQPFVPLSCEVLPSAAAMVWLAQGADAPAGLIGEKGRWRLIAKKFWPERVPPGFILTTATFERLINNAGLRPIVEELNLVRRLGGAREEEKAEILQHKLRLGIREAPMAEGLAERIRRAWRLLQTRSGGAPLIARSAARGEDSETASAAGQNKSVFPILNFEELVAAIAEVRASLFSERSEQYRRTMRPARIDEECSDGKPSMAVIVEKLIPCVAAGVAFDYDPSRSRSGILIEAVRGHGERHVSGTITPSYWFYDDSGKTLLEKKVVHPESASEMGNPVREWQPAPMSDAQAAEVAALVNEVSERCRKTYGVRRVDIEFGFDGEGKLYLFQIRPQTMLPPDDDVDPKVEGVPPEEAERAAWLETSGETGSAGAASGRLVILHEPESMNPEHANLPLARRYLEPGDILLTLTTNIGWSPLFSMLGAVVGERGGVMSHTAIVAREHRRPAVVGAGGLIDRVLKEWGHLPGWAEHEGGKVRIFPEATLDATNLRLCLQRMPIVSAKLRQLLIPSTLSDRSADFYHSRKEFPHFVDAHAVDWTGKPEYPMRQLQFDLYYEGWRKAYRMLPIADSEMPLGVSIARPCQVSGERRVGTIRFDETPLQEGEYCVVAFKTADLAELGDRMRERGVPYFKERGITDTVDQLLAYHNERCEAFRRFVTTMEDVCRARDVRDIDFGLVFDRYSDIISFAHLRAAFRRRVAGPLRAEALAALPPAVSEFIGKMVTHVASGLYTETTHGRDQEYYRLLLMARSKPGVKAAMEGKDADRFLVWLRHESREVLRELVRLAARYKIERGHTDHLENTLKEPTRALAGMLCRDLAAQEDGRPREMFLRTREGYEYEIERLRGVITAAAPEFNFDRFKKLMLLSWEVPALTDNERHWQHRYQHILRLTLRRLERQLWMNSLLPRAQFVFDLPPQRVVELVEKLRRSF